MCGRPAFFRLRAILSEFAVGYFTRSLVWPRRWRRRENCSRRLNWMAAINSGQSAAIGSSSSRAMHIFHTRRQYSYLSTVIARYLPKVISVCGRNRKYSTVWLSWLRPRRSGGLTWIHPTALPFSKIKIPHLSKGKPNILDDSKDQFEEKEKIRTKTKKSSNSTMHTYRGFRCWKHPSAFRMPLPRPVSL